MNHVTKMTAVIMAMLMLAACASTQYIISKADGTMITASSKPKLDQKTGMYTYRDADGKEMSIKQDDVRQIMER